MGDLAGICKALAIEVGNEISNKAIQSSAVFISTVKITGLRPIVTSNWSIEMVVNFSVDTGDGRIYICDMIELSDNIMYQALVNRDSQFEGLFFAAVKTTGIFCRSTCTARKPKQVNVEFFKTSREALVNGYRPCKVCRPLESSGEVPALIQDILAELDASPENRLTDYSLHQRGIDPAMVRRWFLKNHGITFHAYQRLSRINSAMAHIRKGDKVIEAAFESGYESLSGFQHSFKKAVSHSPIESRERGSLTATRISTILGPMMIVANDEGLVLIEFTDRRMLETELKDVQSIYKSAVLPGKSPYFEIAEEQLTEYFEGKRKTFDLPILMPGTTFQRKVWRELMQIPYGITRSYKEQALAINKPEAVRAVARANGFNRLCIVVPCHRVIGQDGHLTGYGGGIWRKKWLLDHEQKHSGSQFN